MPGRSVVADAFSSCRRVVVPSWPPKAARAAGAVVTEESVTANTATTWKTALLTAGTAIVTPMIAPVTVLAALLAGNALVPVSFTTISQSEQSGVEEARQVVVRTPEEWKALWKAHAPGQPMPAVDFTKSMVIGVFVGSRSTAGYRATITAIESEGANVVVTYREDRPGARDILAQMITFPHHLVRVERIAGEVKFTRAER